MYSKILIFRYFILRIPSMFRNKTCLRVMTEVFRNLFTIRCYLFDFVSSCFHRVFVHFLHFICKQSHSQMNKQILNWWKYDVMVRAGISIGRGERTFFCWLVRYTIFMDYYILEIEQVQFAFNVVVSLVSSPVSNLAILSICPLLRQCSRLDPLNLLR